MTPRERVYRAIAFQQTDIVPYHVTFTQGAREKAVHFYGDPNFEDAIGNHLAVLSIRRLAPWIEVSSGHLRDEWGVVWDRTIDRDIGNVENQVLPDATATNLQIPSADYPGIHEKYRDFVECNQDRFRVAMVGMSLFERSWMLRGMEQVLVDMVERPAFVHELLDLICEYHLAQVEIALSYDIDCVGFGDDWGSQFGLIMGPTFWREFIKPRAARLYRRVRESGKEVMIHSCGDVAQLFPDLIEMGLDIFNPFQPETMDLIETKTRYCGGLAFYGGISVQHLLPHGTPEEVRDKTRELLMSLGRGGGYIASPSHAITADVPPENVEALTDVLRAQADWKIQ